MKTIQEALEHELQDLYSAESQILEALPLMAQRASNATLRKAFETHLKQTEKQRERLEKACQILGCEPEGELCMGMQGLLEEAEKLMGEEYPNELMDALLIGAAQKVEHYEIAGYGTVCTLAKTAGQPKIADLLDKTLNEEKATDEKLTKIAEEKVNKKAVKATV